MQQPAPSLGFAPDRALRGRVRALVVDGVILAIGTRLLLGGVDEFAVAALLAVVIQFLYFVVQEAAGGQTIGKHAARVRVVQMDGSVPTLGQVAIRNALRVFDALPLLYASGLVAVMWSGPGRRQRLGDKVAGTAVILQPGGKSHRTPGRLLPALTIASVLLSTVIYGALYREYRTPAVGENAVAPPLAPGFPGDNSVPPGVGNYTAQASLTGVPAQKPVVGSWSIARRCASGTCGYEMSRRFLDETDDHGVLTQGADGWHVVFPTRAFRARCPSSGRVITVRRRATLVIHFDPGSRTAQGHEASVLQAADCVTLSRRLDWSASLASF